MSIRKRLYCIMLAFVMLFCSVSAFAEEKSLDDIRRELTFPSFSNGQSITDVTEGFTLPINKDGAFIVWKSDNENALRIEGGEALVIRPPFGEGYATAGLTAYIYKNEEFTQKNFLLRIRELEIGFTYSDTIKNAYEKFELEFLTTQNIFEIRSDLTLPEADSFGEVSVSYWSDKPEVLSADGKVKRSHSQDETVNFYVCFTEGFETFKTSYQLIVKTYTDDDIRAMVQSDLDEAVSVLRNNYSLTALRQNLFLPNAPKNGSAISFVSGDSTVVDNNGVIYPKNEGNASTTLTVCALLYGYRLESAPLNITVLSKIAPPSETMSNSGIGSGGGGKTEKPDDTTPKTEEEDGENSAFNDISTDHWAYEAVYALTKKGIINGVGGGSFAPDSPLTREQAVKILLPALGISAEPSVSASVFEDCIAGMWYVPYIEAARKKGIVQGISQTQFGVGNYITRQELATIIVRSLETQGISLPEISHTEFTDASEIAPWAKAAADTLSAAGIIVGSNNCFMPNANATRAEAAVIIHRIMSFS